MIGDARSRSLSGELAETELAEAVTVSHEAVELTVTGMFEELGLVIVTTRVMMREESRGEAKATAGGDGSSVADRAGRTIRVTGTVAAFDVTSVRTVIWPL